MTVALIFIRGVCVLTSHPIAAKRYSLPPLLLLSQVLARFPSNSSTTFSLGLPLQNMLRLLMDDTLLGGRGGDGKEERRFAS